MDNGTILGFVAIVIAAGIGVWTLTRSGNPVTPAVVTSALATLPTTAHEITTIVNAGVFAAEKLKLTGRLPDNNAAFNYALKHAQKLLPDLDRETLTTFIESAVILVNAFAPKLVIPDPPPVLPRVRRTGD